jgi:hypothetical protein
MLLAAFLAVLVLVAAGTGSLAVFAFTAFLAGAFAGAALVRYQQWQSVLDRETLELLARAMRPREGQ